MERATKTTESFDFTVSEEIGGAIHSLVFANGGEGTKDAVVVWRMGSSSLGITMTVGEAYLSREGTLIEWADEDGELPFTVVPFNTDEENQEDVEIAAVSSWAGGFGEVPA
jgi:hypothetical protein